MISIKITGPGLVVNTPTAIIYKALKEAGYNITIPEFDGQFQYIDKDDYPDNQISCLSPKNNRNIGLTIEVDPQPWGG